MINLTEMRMRPMREGLSQFFSDTIGGPSVCGLAASGSALPRQAHGLVDQLVISSVFAVLILFRSYDFTT